MASISLKIFLLISIPLILLAIIAIWGGSALLAPSIVRQASLSNVPYVKVSSINVTSAGVFVKLTIIKQGSLSFTPLGGWIEVVDTGQSSNVSSNLVAVFPPDPAVCWFK
ncbi:hypothetical protein [Vulcanisaeta distributa]|uniref:hypothetical protein n=1 Tax=Vulcanisaeta distributa TaxID=164451 RepID=UPI0006D0C1E0|nr:hypothetical protein [Vulcanisaeta distributa]